VRREGSPAEVSSQAENEARPDLTDARPGTPRRAAAILKQAFDPEPDRRPGSASAMIRDLGAALELARERPLTPLPATVPSEPEAVEPEPTAADPEPPAPAEPEPAAEEYERRPFFVSQAKRRRPLL